MGRYVDADKAIDYFRNYKRIAIHRDDIVGYLLNLTITDACDDKCGNWEYPWESDVAKCTVCGFYVQDKINNVSTMYKHCPNCGARMNGRAD